MNATQMAEWEGPHKGTKQSDIDDLEEKALPTADSTEDNEDGGGDVESTEQPEQPPDPVHVPITDEDFDKSTVPLLKHELFIWKVPFKNSMKKPALQGKLREALQQELPVHPVDSSSAPTKRKMIQCQHLQSGAKWHQLEPDIDVEEPSNDGIPGARAPTTPAKDVHIHV